MKRFLLLCILQITLVGFGQIVNIESLRKLSDTSRWSGNASLNFQMIQNKNKIFEFHTKVYVQYLYKKHLVLLVNNFDYKISNRKKLVDKGIGHLRYNYKIRKFFAWEAFTQIQFNGVSNIKYRFLLGTGPRFSLTKWENYKMYIGTSAMYESEHTVEDGANVYRNDFRSSTYFSFAFYPHKKVSIVSTTYFQPLFKRFKDFRVANETVLVLKIFKNLAFNSRISIWYDEIPALGVPKTQFKWSNGITYLFD